MDPASRLGYRLPAEWEPHQGVWLSWPTDRRCWPRDWKFVQRKFAEIALKLSCFETVYVNLIESEWERVTTLLQDCQKQGAGALGRIHFFNHPTDDVWIRDYGPIYLRGRGAEAVAATNWEYNGWGEKHPYMLDDRVPFLIHQSTGVPIINRSMVMEGGAVETNGEGDLVVSRNCLLNPNRNPGLSKDEISRILQEGLGVKRVHWLDGCIEGDDTDGHVDNLVRFSQPYTVLVASTDDPEDQNYEMLRRVWKQCECLRSVSGRRFRIVPVPIPRATYADGRQLPMSYLNFYIANGAVFVPVFGQRGPDETALAALVTAFPSREIIPIDCRKLILEGGALHCLTQQVPQAST